MSTTIEQHQTRTGKRFLEEAEKIIEVAKLTCQDNPELLDSASSYHESFKSLVAAEEKKFSFHLHNKRTSPNEETQNLLKEHGKMLDREIEEAFNRFKKRIEELQGHLN